jgi:hypothetical protein
VFTVKKEDDDMIAKDKVQQAHDKETIKPSKTAVREALKAVVKDHGAALERLAKR